MKRVIRGRETEQVVKRLAAFGQRAIVSFIVNCIVDSDNAVMMSITATTHLMIMMLIGVMLMKSLLLLLLLLPQNLILGYFCREI